MNAEGRRAVTGIAEHDDAKEPEMIHLDLSLARRAVPALAALLGLGLLFGLRAAPASARTPIAPVPGAWCGITDTGGSVRFNISSDGRYVAGIAIATSRGSLVAGEGYRENPTQQIKDSKFILRRDRLEYVCDRRNRSREPIRPEPCRRPPCPPPGCDERRVNELMIRGTFTAPESARGSFTWVPDRQRVVGSYTAWPIDVAPCP